MNGIIKIKSSNTRFNADIAFATLMYRQTIHTLPLASYTLNAVVYAAVVLSAVFMLNAALKKSAVMEIVGTVLPLSLAFISGIFLEQELLPKSISALAQVFPAIVFSIKEVILSTLAVLKVDCKDILKIV